MSNTGDQLTAVLGRMGIRPGDLMCVQSPLSAIGWIDGGAEAVVDALVSVVGPTGTVVTPTFSYGLTDVYDPGETRSRSGRISEALRTRPQSHRSLHPTHSCAAIGHRAAELVAGHANGETFGPMSPLGKLAQWGGWLVLLGASMQENVCVYVGQTIAGAHCLGFGRAILRMRVDGRIRAVRTTLWRSGPCRIEAGPLESRMGIAGRIVDGELGAIDIRAMRAQDVIDTTVSLCAEVCPACTVEPDWASPLAAKDSGPARP